MIIISCANCGKPIEITHDYKLTEGGAAVHANCVSPGATRKIGKTISFAAYGTGGKGTSGRGSEE